MLIVSGLQSSIGCCSIGDGIRNARGGKGLEAQNTAFTGAAGCLLVPVAGPR